MTPSWGKQVGFSRRFYHCGGPGRMLAELDAAVKIRNPYTAGLPNTPKHIFNIFRQMSSIVDN
jgi:hypothetical protein